MDLAGSIAQIALKAVWPVSETSLPQDYMTPSAERL